MTIRANKKQQCTFEVDPFCDHTCPEVVALAKELKVQTEPASAAFRLSEDPAAWQKAYAISAFTWVRDEITYHVEHNWTRPVSWTIKHRRGNCNLKACLLVALLRAVGIEAAFCVEKMDTKAAFFCVAPAIVAKCRQRSLHFSSAVKLAGVWWHVDATVDGAWARGMSGVVKDTYKIEFDGESHAVAGGHEGFEAGVQRMKSIADYMNKKSRVSPAVRKCFNISIEYTRRYGIKYDSAETLGRDVEAFVIKKYTEVFAEAMIIMTTPSGKAETRIQCLRTPISRSNRAMTPPRSRVTPIPSRS